MTIFFAVQAVQNGVAHRFGQLLPGRVERELQFLREAVHHAPVPGVGIVLEGLAHETAARDAALGIGHQQFRMRDLVDAQTAAGPAGALRIVEHEVLGLNVAVDEMMRVAAEAFVETFRFRLWPHPSATCDLHQPVAHQQRGGDSGLDGFLVLRADHEAVHHRVHVA